MLQPDPTFNVDPQLLEDWRAYRRHEPSITLAEVAERKREYAKECARLAEQHREWLASHQAWRAEVDDIDRRCARDCRIILVCGAALLALGFLLYALFGAPAPSLPTW